MPCDTQLAPRQTIQQRAEEIRRAVAALEKRIAKRQVKIVVSKAGGVAFAGWPDGERNRITDACAYRRLMATGSALSKLEIMRAEQAAGRSVDRTAIAQGLHSHDGGATWHKGH